MNENISVGFKVVSLNKDKRLSAFTAVNPRKSSIPQIETGKIVEYAKGKVTIPLIENSKLFAFLEKKDAIFYIKSVEAPAEIWTCELSNPIVNGWFHGIVGSDSGTEDSGIKTFEEFLNWFKNPDSHKKCVEFPSACICDSIKLIERIDEI